MGRRRSLQKIFRLCEVRSMKNAPWLIAACVLAIATFLISAQEKQEKQLQPGEAVAARGVVKRRGSFITVLDYGAKGDGKADDTAAIQDLINAQAGSIRFPAGTYRISK